jgi:hypothetical protein
MISQRGLELLAAGRAPWYIAACTGDDYGELAAIVSEQHPPEDTPERIAFWKEAMAAPHTWRPDNPNPTEAPWARVTPAHAR